jgi:acetyl-CoA C-acetyltransferase
MKKISYIYSAKRTPFGSFRGSLSALSSTNLATTTLLDCFSSSYSFLKAHIDIGFFGCVLQASLGQAPARKVLIDAGISEASEAITINKVCASGLASLCFACDSIALSASNLCIAGGFESMTNAPFCLPFGARNGIAYGGAELYDTLRNDGLSCAFSGSSMGLFSDKIANELGISREEQDAYAIRSYEKTKNAFDTKLFSNFITQIPEVPDLQEDEQLKKFKPEKFSQLKPAFQQNGTATAANSSPISDGAAVLAVASEEAINKYQIKPLAKVIGYTHVAVASEYFTIAPVKAVTQLFNQISWNLSDTEIIHEVNEAFATVPLAYQKKLLVEKDLINTTGGAISMGHPIGASGARLIINALASMHSLGKKKAVVSICNGGGGATALALEKV